MNKTAIMISRAVSAATMRGFGGASMQHEYRDGMRYMRAEMITALAAALNENNPRFNSEAFRAACLARPA
jgi:hypothetical protein